jgi:hypothetical protein
VTMRLPSRAFGGVIPHMVGRYFVTEPEKFGPAVASINSEGTTAALSNVLPAVREAGPKCTPDVIESLVARFAIVHQTDSLPFAER